MIETNRRPNITALIAAIACTLLSLTSAALMFSFRAQLTEIGSDLRVSFLSLFATAVSAIAALLGTVIGVLAIAKSRTHRIDYWTLAIPLVFGPTVFVIAATWPTGQTLLSAVSKGNVRKVQWSLRFGVDPNANSTWGWDSNRGDSVLAIAARKGDRRIVQLLLDAGASVDSPDDKSFPLTLAAAGGHEEIVEALVNAGAEINKADNVGQTALGAAVVGGHFYVAEYLLSLGATPNANVGAAVQSKGWREKLDFLQAHGVDLDAEQGASRYTALMIAAHDGREEAVRYLLDQGCQPNRRNAFRQTAGDYVRIRIADMERWHSDAKAWTPQTGWPAPKIPSEDEWQTQLGPYLRILEMLRDAEGQVT